MLKCILIFRTPVAGLHQNENAGHLQAVTKESEPKYKRKMLKTNKRQEVAYPVKANPTYGMWLKTSLCTNMIEHQRYAAALCNWEVPEGLVLWTPKASPLTPQFQGLDDWLTEFEHDMAPRKGKFYSCWTTVRCTMCSLL